VPLLDELPAAGVAAAGAALAVNIRGFKSTEEKIKATNTKQMVTFDK
jgi:hypothetical protein